MAVVHFSWQTLPKIKYLKRINAITETWRNTSSTLISRFDFENGLKNSSTKALVLVTRGVRYLIDILVRCLLWKHSRKLKKRFCAIATGAGYMANFNPVSRSNTPAWLSEQITLIEIAIT